ncbi:MAG: LuxR C-terminal-related transcriptional regulator [Lactobacillales bacterium]|jgi:DNA-binding CsgD family transcriptional regulator|nr:LuxR C-terminal-related transcriptional regulator [Lactobacillales bacterium]
MGSNTICTKKIIQSYISNYSNYLKHFLDQLIHKYFKARSEKSATERNVEYESLNIPINAGGSVHGFSYKSLSCRELDVLACIIGRCSNKEIANLLNISYKTVEAHVHNILGKINCLTRDAAINSLKETESLDELYNRYERISKMKIFIIEDRKKYFKLKYIGYILISMATLLMTINHFQKILCCTDKEELRITKYFLERKNIAEQIESALAEDHNITIIALVGHGGAGKTTLARRYLWKSNVNLKYEINAETENSLKNSFTDLAYTVAINLSHRDDLKFINGIADETKKYKQQLRFIQKRMKEQSPWVLVLDNLENLEYLKDFCPKDSKIWGNGKVIITTRNENIETVSYLGEIKVIQITELENEEKEKLFSEILEISKDEKVEEFLKLIPGYPLDVSSAAYYIKNTGVSLDNYLKYMQNTTNEFLNTNQKIMSECANYNRTRYGIVTSNFREILGKNQLFADLLCLICLLDSQEIPLQVLRKVKGSVVADSLVTYLKQYSMIICNNDNISIHRSTQSIGLNYLLKRMNSLEKKQIIDKMISILTPYEYLDTNYDGLHKLIPHLKAFLDKIDEVGIDNVDNYKIDLLSAIGDIYSQKECAAAESLKYYKQILDINRKCEYLDEVALALLNLRIGRVYALISKNKEAMEYLSASLPKLETHPLELARNYRLIGSTYMRNNKFDEANKSFDKGIEILDHYNGQTAKARFARADIYSEKAFNYFMEGINRGNAKKSVDIIQKAIDILSQDINQSEQHTRHLITYKSKLSGIYNALGNYDLSLKEGKEAEDLIKTLSSMDNRMFRAQGIIFRERALSHLRLNKIQGAYDYFMKAKEIFSKAMISDYLFRLKMHEAEALIRLDRLDEAFKVCEEIFVIENRERNHYCDLFFNTCYYHAALIKYRENDLESSKKYFKKFFSLMRELCQEIVPEDVFNDLIRQNSFAEEKSDIKAYFEDSLKVFEAIYWKDYEFTKYYIEENLKNL